MAKPTKPEVKQAAHEVGARQVSSLNISEDDRHEIIEGMKAIDKLMARRSEERDRLSYQAVFGATPS